MLTVDIQTKTTANPITITSLQKIRVMNNDNEIKTFTEETTNDFICNDLYRYIFVGKTQTLSISATEIAYVIFLKD